MKSTTELTNNWLRVGFGSVPTLTKEQLIEKAELLKKLLIEEADEFIEAVRNGDILEQKNACSDLNFVCGNFPFFAGLSPYEIEQEDLAVYESNMTKFCRTEEEAKQSVEMYFDGTHPNKLNQHIVCEYMPTGDAEYPFRVQTLSGKIMKSHLFLDVENFRK